MTASVPSSSNTTRLPVGPQPVPSRPAVALALACVGVFVIILDATIVSVALPHIGADLRFGRSSVAWVVNAYTLAFGGALLVAGRLVTNHGTRFGFLTGVGCFGIASLACGLAPTAWVLVAARALQGLAGALVMPATLTMATAAYPDERRRARALGLWSAVGAAGGAAGTVAGGLLTDLAGWRWVFLVNVPITLAAVLGGPRVLAAGRSGSTRARLDLPGAALATAGLVALVYGVLDGGTDGWSGARVVASLTAAVVLLGLFLIHLHRWTSAPLVPPRLFRSRHVSTANAVIFCLGLGFFASPVLLSLYLQDALGYSPLRAGLAFLPAAAALFVGAQTAGQLTHRFGVRTVATGGALGAVAGFGWLTQLSDHTSYWPGLVLPQLLFGLGIGTAFTPITLAATAVPPALAGVAAGVLNTVRQVAAALGLAILSTLATSQPGDPATGYDQAFLIATCTALVAAAVAALLLPQRPAAPPSTASDRSAP
ncbi:DHA2 family efflux MFS transporter permease subunit [Pseudofrankia sp. BMG5.36]|uniref:DHA2 family efflux MFS transporter permease subunit n=1 Tax=Pseudofrankia sp. BMG5.36 TaxID=1834512 RepID=UPI0009F28F62|nr:DHA2 family efflux MFS transporter permease subunit [Pseudofrankia sp. BMG5.36]